MADADIRWRFREMLPAEINQTPMEREFFAGEPINTRLVREAIQNSLDASMAKADAGGYGGAPVRVRFSLAGIHSPLPAAMAAKYFTGIAPHLNALPDDDIDDAIALRAARGDLTHDGLPFMVIEDAGTVGLDGDWAQFDDNADLTADNNHFYWFFRNIGRSGKGDSDNGSWGLGKWVFPDASHASAYIAVTRRRSDGETLLIGQSVLSKHTIDKRRYAPYGYFAISGDNELPLPMRRSDPAHAPFIDGCIADFGLQYRSEPGLSVIIPFPRIEDGEAHIETPMILAAIVHNYFYAIITRRLEVTLDEGDGSPPVEITADTIDDVLERAKLDESGEQSAAGYRSLFDMCRQCLDLGDNDYIDISVGDLNNKDYRGIAELRRRYNAYELLAFRVSTTVQRKKGARERSSFRIYAQRDDSLREGHDYYVRGTLSIANMNYLGQTRARSLLVVDETDPLAAMLRDSEPPAHTLWRVNAHRATERWVSVRHRINGVRYAPRDIIRSMDIPAEQVQKDVFKDIFFYERPDERAAANRRPSGGRTVPPEGPRRQTRQDFVIQNTNSGTGFRVRIHADRIQADAENPPTLARLRAAYEVARGNPLKQYSPNDFRLHGQGALNVDLQGCQLVEQAQERGDRRDGNELVLRIDDPADFALTVQGFDPNRDVYVRVERLANMADTPDMADAALPEGDGAG